MLRKNVLIIGIIVILLIAGCATTPKYTPFKVPKEEFYAKTKTIALAPLVVTEGISDLEPVKATYESLLEAKLKEAAFSVLPSSVFADIFKQITEQVGGIYDPITGKIDEAKSKTVQEYTCEELGTKCNADVILFPSIQVFSVYWSGGAAIWHGTSEPISSVGHVLLETFAGISGSGTVPALSLIVIFQDLYGGIKYVNYGGIQLMKKHAKGGYVSVPREKLFSDEERNKNSVNIALGPLLEKTEPTKVTKKKGKQH
jgi:hypothetical protein